LVEAFGMCLQREREPERMDRKKNLDERGRYGVERLNIKCGWASTSLDAGADVACQCRMYLCTAKANMAATDALTLTKR
jgi:hypothetical protein